MRAADASRATRNRCGCRRPTGGRQTSGSPVGVDFAIRDGTEGGYDWPPAAEQYIESVGGKLHGFWYAFGEHDGYNLWEAPDNVSMAAVVVAIGACGALGSVETTVLLTVEETLAALDKARSIKYNPPGS